MTIAFRVAAACARYWSSCCVLLTIRTVPSGSVPWGTTDPAPALAPAPAPGVAAAAVLVAPAGAGGGCGTPAVPVPWVTPRMADSICGFIICPKGVLRNVRGRLRMCSGIFWPTRNVARSWVKLLQLWRKRSYDCSFISFLLQSTSSAN